MLTTDILWKWINKEMDVQIGSVTLAETDNNVLFYPTIGTTFYPNSTDSWTALEVQETTTTLNAQINEQMELDFLWKVGYLNFEKCAREHLVSALPRGTRYIEYKSCIFWFKPPTNQSDGCFTSPRFTDMEPEAQKGWVTQGHSVVGGRAETESTCTWVVNKLVGWESRG